jgi:F5/8 type C domain
MKSLANLIGIVLMCSGLVDTLCQAQVLDKQAKLTAETFWDNQDFEWFAENIPFFECPDADITTTYYYRWELLTKHLTYGSANTGYLFTEFIDRPFWSGAYGAISCPAGHQLYEARWLRSPRIANDYSRYWLRTPGAQPRNYSTWLADSVKAVDQVHPDPAFTTDLLPDLIKNYEGWMNRHFVPAVGLFWQTGHDDGMEFNIASRQTRDILRGAPSYRPSFNAYMWADAIAIAELARRAGRLDHAQRFDQFAADLKNKMIELLWDEKRQFFFPVFKNDEERDGHQIKALTKVYESGQFAGDPHGRELIGYVPWQFSMLSGETRFEVAWKKLMDRDGFYADFGPSTVERNDPMFLLQKSCCWWSGQSWPYATTQTLKGLANILQQESKLVSSDDYLKSLQIYARSHRKNGKPYLAEALHPDTGSFEGHDAYNHSEHYFHSGYCDLIITGLIGLIPRDDDHLELHPLAPSDWEYFALDDVPYRGHRLSIVWDKSGQRYGQGLGMSILVDGKKVGGSPTLGRILLYNAVPLKTVANNLDIDTGNSRVNWIVNNDGNYFPRLTTSYTAEGSSSAKLNDGNYWYLKHPPNRWTCENSPNQSDWIEIDLGQPRLIDTIKLYLLDDSLEAGSKLKAPARIELAVWEQGQWQTLNVPDPVQTVPASKAASNLERPVGHRPTVVKFQPQQIAKLRVTLHHQAGNYSGLTEIEAWGSATLPVRTAAMPAGNLAYNDGSKEYPKASASHTDRFGGAAKSAIDGITNFLPTPMNRWTSYESPSTTDWLEIDFGKAAEFRRVELAIYDDRGGVQPPKSYDLQYWDGQAWQPIQIKNRTTDKPVGSQWNTVMFAPVTGFKLRLVFTHQGNSRSGVTEVMIWNE